MNTDEAIKKIYETGTANRDAVSRILAAEIMANATHRLADEKKRQMDMQETLMERFGPLMDMYANMIAKMGPAVDASMQMMQDEMEGEKWKHSGDEDNED